MSDESFIHDTAIVEDDVTIGARSKVWHHCHVRSGASIGDDVSLGKGVFVDVHVDIGDGPEARRAEMCRAVLEP